MGASELGSPEGDDEETRRTRGDTPARPEQPSRPETRDAGSDATERTSAETLTREEYADDMRGQGDPIPSGDGDGDGGPDRAEPDERDSDDTAAEDDRAEPRDRETYADDMRADDDDADADADRERATTADEDAAAPSTTAEGSYGEPGMEPAEPRSRDEYAEAVRDESSDGAEQTDGSAADEASTETGTGWPADPGGDQDTAPEGQDPDTAVSEQDTSGEQPGEADSPSGAPSATVTHYHSDFKDQPVDLYTDGSRWATGERVDGENVAGERPDRSPGDTSDLPPTGEQLIGMESDKASRAERMRQEGYREAGDVLDVTSKWADVAHDLLARDQPSGHAEISTRPEISPAPHHGINPGDAASALLLFTALGAEAIGLGVKNWHERKGHQDGSKR